MKIRNFLLVSVFGLSLVLSACAPAKPGESMMDEPTEEMMAEPTDAMMEKTEEGMVEPTEEMMAEPTDAMMEKTEEGAMMEAPAWFGATLTDVSTGKTFTLSDYKDKVVLVELMAQWCSTCKKQQMEVKSLHEQLGMPADLITIALDIDPNESGEDLKTYAAGNSFDWIYAISPADVSREIGNLYGDQFLNPPSAPMLIIDRKGEVHPLPFGIKSADDLMKAIDPYLKGM